VPGGRNTDFHAFANALNVSCNTMMLRVIKIVTILILLSCSQQAKKNGKMDAFDLFINKEKFLEERTMLYPGISDPVLKPILTDKINKAAEDFRKASLKANPTKQHYLDALDKGLSRFDRLTPFDTEDRERVGHYFEELMQIVGLNSSEGRLNKFLYGFDPDQPIQSQ